MIKLFLASLISLLFAFPSFAAITFTSFPEGPVTAGETFDFSFTLDNKTVGMTVLSSASLGSNVRMRYFLSDGSSVDGGVLWSNNKTDAYNYPVISESLSVMVPSDASSVQVEIYQGIKWGNTRRYQRYSRIFDVVQPPAPDPEPGDDLPEVFNDIKAVFDWLISEMLVIWDYLLNKWSILGTFLIFGALVRWIVRVFNRLKS